MPAIRPAHVVEADPLHREMQVRTRQAAYLNAFRDRYCPSLGDNEHFPSHDYQWKAAVSRAALAEAMAKMVLDINYDKFKPTTEHEAKFAGGSGLYGLGDRKLAGALHTCYTAMWSIQLRDTSDGTSSYNKPWSYAKNPQNCLRLGHYFTQWSQKCQDCDAPKPKSQVVGGAKAGTGWGGEWPASTGTQAKAAALPAGPVFPAGTSLAHSSKPAIMPGQHNESSWFGVSGHYSLPCGDCGEGYVTQEGHWRPHLEPCLGDEPCPACEYPDEGHDAECHLDPENADLMVLMGPADAPAREPNLRTRRRRARRRRARQARFESHQNS